MRGSSVARPEFGTGRTVSPRPGRMARSPRQIRVLVADDDDGVREGIAAVVSTDPSLRLVGVGADADEAVELARQTSPDVVLLDVRMPKGGGIRAAKEILSFSPMTKVIALSGSTDRAGVIEMLGTGAVGYLVKSPRVNIIEGIHAASAGEGVISNEVAADVIGELTQHLTQRTRRTESRKLRVEAMRQMIADRSLKMAFQPIIELRTGNVAGVEALARFSSFPQRAPDSWFAEAWRLGLGAELELAALSTALEASRDRPAGVFLTLNVSPEAALSARVCGFLECLEAADALVVEITEHAVVKDYDALNSSLGPARERGLRVAVDDAGAGYASLRHILRLKPDLIKLDVSLIEGIDDDRSKRALASGLISFAHQIEAQVVAEGIETSLQLECVTDLGADYGQGHHFGEMLSFLP